MDKNYGVVLGGNITALYVPRARMFADKFIWVEVAGEGKMLKLPLSEVYKLLRDKMFQSEMKRAYKHLTIVESENGE